MNQERLKLLLSAVDDRLQVLHHKAEAISIDYAALQVEHIIPQEWRQEWPITETDPGAALLAEQSRQSHLHRIGNLTLVTGSLNVTLTNDPWGAKRSALEKHSKLELNARLVALPSWDEEAVDTRSNWLASEIDQVWPGPESKRWDA